MKRLEEKQTNKQTKLSFFRADVFQYSDQAMEYNEDSEKTGGETNKQTKLIFFRSKVFQYSDQAIEYNEDSEKIGGKTNKQTNKT